MNYDLMIGLSLLLASIQCIYLIKISIRLKKIRERVDVIAGKALKII